VVPTQGFEVLRFMTHCLEQIGLAVISLDFCGGRNWFVSQLNRGGS
jgi:hypothetical protein